MIFHFKDDWNITTCQTLWIVDLQQTSYLMVLQFYKVDDNILIKGPHLIYQYLL